MTRCYFNLGDREHRLRRGRSAASLAGEEPSRPRAPPHPRGRHQPSPGWKRLPRLPPAEPPRSRGCRVPAGRAGSRELTESPAHHSPGHHVPSLGSPLNTWTPGFLRLALCTSGPDCPWGPVPHVVGCSAASRPAARRQGHPDARGTPTPACLMPAPGEDRRSGRAENPCCARGLFIM